MLSTSTMFDGRTFLFVMIGRDDFVFLAIRFSSFSMAPRVPLGSRRTERIRFFSHRLLRTFHSFSGVTVFPIAVQSRSVTVYSRLGETFVWASQLWRPPS